MKKIGRRTGREQSAEGQRRLPLRELAQEALWDAAMLSGLRFAREQLKPSAPHCAGRAMRVWPSARRCVRDM